MRKLDYNTYQDKVLGGWIGKSAGGILGAPMEGYKRFNDIQLSEDLFDTNYPNDDLDLQVLWLDLAKKAGPSVRSADFGDHWKKHVDFPWNEYGIATRNLKLGVYPPVSGKHNNDYWKESMGCPIRSEIWGMLCPGMPGQAAFYARMDASLDHENFSVQAEMFLSACGAEAFFMSDPGEIIKKTLGLFPEDTTIHRLVSSVLHFQKNCSYEVAKGKIKSMWGDADFTSAPQNIAFAILALLESEGKFEAIMNALNLGHDSDCIAATVGALLGIINGYSNISTQWKELVGDELMVSPEIRGINYADSLSGLARETCRAGISYIRHYNQLELINCDLKPYPEEESVFSLDVDVSGIRPSLLEQEQSLKLTLENLHHSEGEKDFEIEIKSEDLKFSKNSIKLKGVRAFESRQFELGVSLKKNLSSLRKPALGFSLHVKSGGVSMGTVERGIPFYGSWLLAGPFIEDNPEIEAMDEKYPDHGLSSMPGVNYMNHDRLNLQKDFLDITKLEGIAAEAGETSLPFLTQRIHPDSFKIRLNDYFHGRGERSLYLYTKVWCDEPVKKWLSVGCNAYYRVWVNNKPHAEQMEIRRSWPTDTAIEAELLKGENQIAVRVDMPLDVADIEIGFKDFVNKHAHQSQWDISLVPYL